MTKSPTLMAAWWPMEQTVPRACLLFEIAEMQNLHELASNKSLLIVDVPAFEMWLHADHIWSYM